MAWQSMHNLSNADFAIVKHILRYLQGTKSHGLLQKSTLIIICLLW